jgi:hypothetical protein
MSEHRERVLATSYMEIMANRSVREMLQKAVDLVNAHGRREDIDRIVDQAIEAYFGLKLNDLDAESLGHAREETNRAVRRMTK